MQLTKEDIFQLFNGEPRKLYKKRGRFISRPAVPYETILTIVSGHLETLKRASEGDWVIRNIEIGSSAETYIISGEKYKKRYEAVVGDFGDIISHTIDNQGWFEVLAKGRCLAREYRGDQIQFMAPWGEPMVCENGDFLARPVPGDPNDIYRIERKTFEQTYSQESVI